MSSEDCAMPKAPGRQIQDPVPDVFWHSAASIRAHPDFPLARAAYVRAVLALYGDAPFTAITYWRPGVTGIGVGGVKATSIRPASATTVGALR